MAPPPPAGAPPPKRGLTKLEGLNLWSTKITDAGCARLAAALDSGALPALTMLCLTQASGDALSYTGCRGAGWLAVIP